MADKNRIGRGKEESLPILLGSDGTWRVGCGVRAVLSQEEVRVSIYNDSPSLL